MRCCNTSCQRRTPITSVVARFLSSVESASTRLERSRKSLCNSGLRLSSSSNSKATFRAGEMLNPESRAGEERCLGENPQPAFSSSLPVGSPATPVGCRIPQRQKAGSLRLPALQEARQWTRRDADDAPSASYRGRMCRLRARVENRASGCRSRRQAGRNQSRRPRARESARVKQPHCLAKSAESCPPAGRQAYRTSGLRRWQPAPETILPTFDRAQSVTIVAAKYYRYRDPDRGAWWWRRSPSHRSRSPTG